MRCGTQISPSSCTAGFGINRNSGAHDIELTAGHAIKAAIHAGLRVDALILNEEPYLDIGTPDDLLLAVKNSIGAQDAYLEAQLRAELSMKAISRANKQTTATHSEKSNTLQEKAHRFIPGGCHTYAKGDDQYPENAPAFIVKGKGCHVWDVDGNEFIEYGMGIRAVTLGHAYPPVVEAAYRQMLLGIILPACRHRSRMLPKSCSA